ncbi:MAG: hypothetical protein ACPG1A_01490, partial [Halioglobus sp.]
MTITLFDARGNETTEIARGAAGTIQAKVKPNRPNILVTATTNLGAILPATGTALTNNDGVAVFTLEAGIFRGAGTITASATVSEVAVSNTLDFQVGVSNVKLGYFDQNGNFIENAIGVEPDSTLAGDGRAQLSLSILDTNDRLVLTPEEVRITSPCLTSGLAALDPPSPVISVNGRVQ